MVLNFLVVLYKCTIILTGHSLTMLSASVLRFTLSPVNSYPTYAVKFSNITGFNLLWLNLDLLIGFLVGELIPKLDYSISPVTFSTSSFFGLKTFTTNLLTAQRHTAVNAIFCIFFKNDFNLRPEYVVQRSRVLKLL